MKEVVGEEFFSSRRVIAFDYGVVAVLSPIAVPLTLAAAAAVRVVDGVPPFYHHDRPGHNDKSFEIWKVQTMGGEQGAIRSIGGWNDPRATPIGRELRKTRVDELPQLINIVKREMSGVGVRPLVEIEEEEIADRLDPAARKEWLTTRRIVPRGLVDKFGCDVYRRDYAVDTIERVPVDNEYRYTASIRVNLEIFADCLDVFFSTALPSSASQVAVSLQFAARFFGLNVTTAEVNAWRTTLLFAQSLKALSKADPEADLEGVLFEVFEKKTSSVLPKRATTTFVAMIDEFDEGKRQQTFANLLEFALIQKERRNLSFESHARELTLHESKTFASFFQLDERHGKRRRQLLNSWVTTIAHTSISLDEARHRQRQRMDLDALPTVPEPTLVGTNGSLSSNGASVSGNGHGPLGILKTFGASLVHREHSQDIGETAS